MAASVNGTGLPPQTRLGFRRPNPRSLTTPYTSMGRLDNNKFQQRLSTPSILRLCNALRLQTREKFGGVVLASSKSGDSLKDESGEIKDGKSGQSPPFLTILAGFLVVFLVVWIMKSIIMWLIDLLLIFTTSK